MWFPVFYCIIRKFYYIVLFFNCLQFHYEVLLALERPSNIWALAINLWALSPAKDRLPLTNFSKRIQICGFGTVSHPQGTSLNTKTEEGKKKQRIKIQSCLSPNMGQAATISLTAKWYYSQVDENFSWWNWGEFSLFFSVVHLWKILSLKCDTGDWIYDV